RDRGDRGPRGPDVPGRLWRRRRRGAAHGSRDRAGCSPDPEDPRDPPLARREPATAAARRLGIRLARAHLADLRARLPGLMMGRQLVASILIALAIVAVTIAIVTAKLGPNAKHDHGGHHGAGTEHSGHH